jgi:hypothetical protein
MPGVGVMGLKEYAEHGDAAADGRETPPQILEIIRQQLTEMENAIRVIESGSAPAGEMECVYFDVKCWHALGSYYLRKFEAAIALLTGQKDKAVTLLTEAVEFWKELSFIGSQHYLPYQLTRVDQLFGWSYYIKEVERDIARAEEYQLSPP